MEEKKPNKTLAIVGTIAAILLCGCPGLSICAASIVTVAGYMPYTTTINGFTTTGTAPVWLGVVGLCLSVIFVAIAVLVPVLTLRKKKGAPEPAMDILPPQEPLPPAS
jgi:formate hydrogenlyase subunit 3/multisubunit Na+/H+ antiporter MnhD subunit